MNVEEFTSGCSESQVSERQQFVLSSQAGYVVGGARLQPSRVDDGANAAVCERSHRRATRSGCKTMKFVDPYKRGCIILTVLTLSSAMVSAQAVPVVRSHLLNVTLPTPLERLTSGPEFQLIATGMDRRAARAGRRCLRYEFLIWFASDLKATGGLGRVFSRVIRAAQVSHWRYRQTKSTRMLTSFTLESGRGTVIGLETATRASLLVALCATGKTGR